MPCDIEKAKKLAERLLKKNFPAMRQKETITPGMKVEKETPKKIKDRKIYDNGKQVKGWKDHCCVDAGTGLRIVRTMHANG